MTEETLERLEGLAESDPAVAPLALLQVEALRGSTDPSWDQAIPPLDARRLVEGAPLLEGLTLALDGERVAHLFRRLAAVGARQTAGEAEAIYRVLSRSELDPFSLLEASIAQDTTRLRSIADRVGVDVSLLATLAHLAALPLLQACGRRAVPLLSESNWKAGYCPVCAAWPVLAELRGLERQRWLRCGRCGAGWRAHVMACVFCENTNHQTLSYLAAESERDSRRAETCDQCHGYLKSVATLGPLSATGVLVQDLTTLELDVAAMEEGYARPEDPGFALHLHLEPSRAGNGWLPWRK